MNRKVSLSSSHTAESLKLSRAVQMYIAEGGVINVVQDGESGEYNAGPTILETPEPEADAEVLMKAKVELLRGLVAKGAGVSALQYSLKMNRRDIKRLATENGLTIRFSQPVLGANLAEKKETGSVDDVVAGHAMHYSSLGYTAPEIAQLLEISIREVWRIGKAYRIEFKQPVTRSLRIWPAE